MEVACQINMVSFMFAHCLRHTASCQNLLQEIPEDGVGMVLSKRDSVAACDIALFEYSSEWSTEAGDPDHGSEDEMRKMMRIDMTMRIPRNSGKRNAKWEQIGGSSTWIRTGYEQQGILFETPCAEYPSLHSHQPPNFCRVT